MKILLVTPEYPPHFIGGGGIVFQSMARALSSRDIDVTVVSGYFPTKSYFERVFLTHDGSQIKVFWLPLMPTPKTPFHLRTVMPPNIWSALCLVRIFFKQNFNVVHLHGFGHLIIDFAALLCVLFGKQYILTLHGFPRSPLKARFTEFLYRIYLLTAGRLTLRKANRITTVSAAIKREAVAHGVSERRIAVIPNGLNIAKYERMKNSIEFRQRLGIDPSDHIIMAIGILHERKGFRYLIEAMPLIGKQYENIKLIIVGRDCGHGQKLKELAEQLHVEDKIIFTGFLNFEMKLMAMSEAEVFVIPSLVEPFGLVALEAMACGKPIVAARVGGLKDVLEDGKTGLMLDPGSAEALADAIVRLINNKELRLTLSRNTREEVRKYDWKIIGQMYLNVY